MTIERELADVVVSTMHQALAPVLADVRLLQTQVAGWEARWSDLGSLRERVAVVEDRAKAAPVSAVLETREAVDLAPVLSRLDALEQREPIAGPPGQAGEPGKDAPPVDIDAIVARVSALIPVPKDGRDGERGESGKDAPPVDLDEIAIRAAVLIPAPKDGEPGPVGPEGKPGKDAPVVDVSDLAHLAAALIPIPKNGENGTNGIDGKDADVDELVRRAVALIPVPKDGKDAPVIDVEDVAKRAALLIPVPRDGQPGVPGAPGRDGVGERGEKGQDGAPGRDGTLEGVSLEQLDERSWRLVRADGTPLSGQYKSPSVLDRGVYQAGRLYEKGDGVTFGGSFWIAQGETAEKPGDGATAWRLAVKRGRDGAKGDPGERGGSGPKGEKGDPGRNFS